jgi:hypothetical protein
MCCNCGRKRPRRARTCLTLLMFSSPWRTWKNTLVIKGLIARVNRTKKTNPLNTSEDECSKEVPLDTYVEGEASDYSLGYTWPSDTNPSFAGLETLGDCKVTLRRGEASDATSYGPKLNITIKTRWNWWWLVAVTKVEPLTTISRPTWTNLASSSFLFFFFFFFWNKRNQEQTQRICD